VKLDQLKAYKLLARYTTNTMSLPTRKIGSTDVSAIGFGAMGLSIGYGGVPSDEERFKVAPC
jgi:hypothetical protein